MESMDNVDVFPPSCWLARFSPFSTLSLHSLWSSFVCSLWSSAAWTFRRISALDGNQGLGAIWRSSSYLACCKSIETSTSTSRAGLKDSRQVITL